MARSSRTYKLRLSHDGVDCLHHAHHRIGCLAHELISYGTTLFVAVTLLERLDASELVAQIDQQRCAELSGEITCFVGFPLQLAEIIERISRRVDASGEHDRTSVGRLYIAAILTLLEADDHQILRAFRSACVVREVQRKRD